jgi:hypothetical protein
MSKKVELSYGKAAKGTALHIIVPTEDGKSYQALCNKKIMNIFLIEDKEPKDVSCAKCKKLKVYKEMITPADAAKPPTPAPKKKAKAKAALKKAKPKAKASEPKTETIEAHAPEEKAKPEEVKEVEQKEVKVAEIPNTSNDFDLCQQSNGLFKIIHKQSQYDFFKNLPMTVAVSLITKLSNITIRWNGKGSLPKEFMSCVMGCYNCAHSELGLELPRVNVEEDNTKSDCPIPRQNKGKVERKISRRAKEKTAPSKVVKNISRRPMTIKSAVLQMLKNGITEKAAIEKIVEQFGVTEKKAQGKFKLYVRVFGRFQSNVIMHVMKPERGADFYQFRDRFMADVKSAIVNAAGKVGTKK